ncbi:MAG: DUF4292 domain-containing protein [Saprospiraceae bacterium]
MDTKALTKVKDLDELIEKIYTHQEYKFYSAKGEVEYSGSDFSGNADASLKIIKDSLALLTIKKFGIELFRILLDKDSVTVMDRIQNTWSKSSINSWTKSYSVPLDFIMIQDVLTTGLYLTEYLSYELSTTPHSYLIKGNSELFQMNNELFYAPVKPFKIMISQNSSVVKIDFLKHLLVDKKNYPSTIQVYFQDAMKPEAHSIHIDWKEIKINSPEQIKFEIPKSYTKLN